eukprot:scaffold98688_cov18-Tisochrysis_lutea.AAC.1
MPYSEGGSSRCCGRSSSDDEMMIFTRNYLTIPHLQNVLIFALSASCVMPYRRRRAKGQQ